MTGSSTGGAPVTSATSRAPSASTNSAASRPGTARRTTPTAATASCTDLSPTSAVTAWTAGGAEADHPEATRVGGHRAADRGRVARRQVDPVAPPGLGRRGLYLGHGRAGPGGELPGIGVDVLEPGQATGRQHHLAPQRHRAAHEPGVPALGHHRHPGAAAPADDLGDLRGAPGADDGRRGADEAPGPVGGVGREDVGVGEHVVGADDRAQLEDRGGTDHVR